MENRQPSNLKLTSVLREWIAETNWPEVVQINDENNYARFKTVIEIEDQLCCLIVEVDEINESLYLYLYTPFKVAPDRMDDMTQILNAINNSRRMGRLACKDDKPIQYLISIDVEGSQLTAMQIKNMFAQAFGVFMDFFSVLAAVALTDIDPHVAWDSFLMDDDEKYKHTRSEKLLH